ncbi:MAG: PP2C family protein-serine/threonine phosphatase [Burkholderiaceae bacterium]
MSSISGGIRYHFAHATHRGMVREQNEDAVAIAEQVGLALIADGMGGYNAGEVASGLAAEFLVTHLVDDLEQLHRQSPAREDAPSQRLLHSLLRARVDGANDAIIDAANRNPDLNGMGTTLALLLFTGPVVTTLHVGDSRVYRLREGGLSLLTRDHSLLQEQIDAGVLTPGEARMSINRNFVTRALGVDVLAEPEINEYDLAPGDLYLICSDGLPDMLSDEEIYDLLRGPVDDDDFDDEIEGKANGEVDSEGSTDRGADRMVAEVAALEEMAAKLVDAANGHGGRDNVSVVLASVGWSHEEGGMDEGLAIDRDKRASRRA